MELTTTTEVDPAVAIFYDRVLLEVALPELVHDKFAQRRPIPKKHGDQLKFRRYSSLTVATTPLSEGITPPGEKLAKTDMTVMVKQYGHYVHVSDWVDLTVEDPVLTVAAERLGENLGETVDELIRDILAACASATDATGGDNADTPTELTKADIDGVVKTLLGNRAKMIRPVIPAAQGQGTSPVRASYFAITDTDIVDDLEAVSGFKACAEYPRQTGILDAEWGSTGNVRWLLTDKGYVDTGTSQLSADEYYCMIFGKNAYGITEIEGGAARNIVKAYGSGGTSDPLNQRATSGWKLTHACRILNDNFMHILKCTHS